MTLDENRLEDAVREVEAYLVGNGRPPTGPPIVCRHLGAGLPPRKEGTPVDVMFPVAASTPPPEGFEKWELAPEAVAYTIYNGRTHSLRAAEEFLLNWTRMKRLRARGEVRRVYHKRAKNPKKNVTEVQIPLAPDERKES